MLISRLIFFIFLFFPEKTDISPDINDNSEDNKKDDMELQIYDFNTIAKATNNFADKNKLGEGGFGPVYKVTKQ